MADQIGDFVPRGGPLFHVWGRDVPRQRLLECVALDDERTPYQDTAFAFRQLVDIAERALSPGINDPTTAVQCIDRIHDLLRSLATRHIPSPLRADRPTSAKACARRTGRAAARRRSQQVRRTR